MSQFLDMYDDYLTEDYETLFSEETLLFMEKASEPVKKSFFQKMINGLKALFEKVSEMSHKLVQKLSIGKIKKAVDANPELKKKKLKTKDYDKSLKLGKDTSEKIKKAKSAKEVKKITDGYKAKRKKILAATIGVTVGALVVGGGAFAAHKYLKHIKGDIKDIEILSGDVVDGSGRILNRNAGELPGNGKRALIGMNNNVQISSNNRKSGKRKDNVIYQGGPGLPRISDTSSATREEQYNKALKTAVYGNADVQLKRAQCTALATVNNDMLGDIKASNEFVGGELGRTIQIAKSLGYTFGDGGKNNFVMRS